VNCERMAENAAVPRFDELGECRDAVKIENSYVLFKPHTHDLRDTYSPKNSITVINDTKAARVDTTSELAPRRRGTGRLQVRRLALINAAAAVVAALVAFPGSFGPAAADETLPPQIGNNGKKIYLSPAFHTDVAGARGECEVPSGTARKERDMASNLARRVADLKATRSVAGGTEIVVANSGLMYRGFTTRIGNADFDINVSSSNSWNAHAHIPLHSNAGLNYACSNVTNNRNSAGAVVMYQSGASSTLANRIKFQLQAVTPGLNDKYCVPGAPDYCSGFSSLAELSADAGARAYSETEFHDWNAGVNFLVYERNLAALRIAIAIDNHF
jgi:hypothetical protein